MGVVDLFNYKDPSITQYKIYDKRLDGTELNFGENYGGFLFGIQNANEAFETLDPMFGRIEFWQFESSLDSNEM